MARIKLDTTRARPPERPITLAITAIGGQGGGVLAEWIVALAEANGYLAQYTSVAGVAQRTGATIYYLELFPEALAKGRQPVLALMPVSGDVDIVLAAELMEAGRAMVRGLVSADRTTLIASSHRIYGITEKTARGDGIAKTDKVIEAARRRAKQLVLFDMDAVAREAGSVISAAMFGALAGSKALPFKPESYEAAITAGGVGVAASLKAFRVAFERTERGEGDLAPATPAPPEPATPGGRALLERAQAIFPAAVLPIVREGLKRLCDYQDRRYAAEYLDRLVPVLSLDSEAQGWRLTSETARHLALWMSYEDVVRVADLKTRRARFERVRQEAKAGASDLVTMSEYLHPRFEEFCDTLPAGFGGWLSRQAWAERLLKRLFAEGRRIETGKLGGFLLLSILSSLRPLRRSTRRYSVETANLTAWLDRIVATAATDYDLAVEIALSQALVKGYGDTHARGMHSFAAIMGETGADAARIRSLRAAALADEGGTALQASLKRPA